MKLLLTLPAPWIEAATDQGSIWTRPDSTLRVELGLVVPLPEDRKAWGEQVIYGAMTPGGSVKQVDIVDTKTRRGWPATVVSLAYRDALHEPTEFRVVLFLELLYYGSVVTCVVPKAESESWESQLRAEVIPLIQEVDVDFSSEQPAHLKDIYN